MGECVHNNQDDLSFEEIFKLHHRRVYVLCLRMTGNVAEAEDLTEEVFGHVFRLGRFREEAAFSSWLHRLTVNRVLLHFRRSVASKEQTSKDDELPAASVESSKRLDRVPILDRITLNEGLRHTEIARALGRSGTTSKSRLHKARMKLRQLLTRRITPGKIDDVIGPDPMK